ncbi:hypothetical protein Tco_0013677 [Tanacetum coccineum]
MHACDSEEGFLSREEGETLELVDPQYKAMLVARGFTQRAAGAAIDDKDQSPRQWYMRFDEYIEQCSSVAVTTAAYITGVMHQAEIGSTKSYLKRIRHEESSGKQRNTLNNNGKTVPDPLGGHFKLSIEGSPRLGIVYVERMSKGSVMQMRWELNVLRCAPARHSVCGAHDKVKTKAYLLKSDWSAVIIIDYYQASQSPADQSGCDT